MTGNPIVLSVHNLTKTYRSAGEQIEVLRGVNLSVAAGERVALTGESGSGKSTLLHLIAGLDRPDNGEISIADTPVLGLSDANLAALRRERLGLVFQHPSPSGLVGGRISVEVSAVDDRVNIRLEGVVRYATVTSGGAARIGVEFDDDEETESVSVSIKTDSTTTRR